MLWGLGNWKGKLTARRTLLVSHLHLSEPPLDPSLFLSSGFPYLGPVVEVMPINISQTLQG